MTKKDHDILIELRTDVKYIRKFVCANKKNIVYLKKQNQARKDWQEDFDTKTRVFIGVATFFGGIIVFVGNKVWDFFMSK